MAIYGQSLIMVPLQPFAIRNGHGQWLPGSTSNAHCCAVMHCVQCSVDALLPCRHQSDRFVGDGQCATPANGRPNGIKEALGQSESRIDIGLIYCSNSSEWPAAAVATVAAAATYLAAPECHRELAVPLGACAALGTLGSSVGQNDFEFSINRFKID